MFDKERFKIKLDFMVRQWHTVGAGIIQEYGEAKADAMMNFFWTHSLATLWSTRFEKRVYAGIDCVEDYQTFCEYITTAFNQLSNNICLTKENETENFATRVIEQNKLVREFVNNMADEFEENFIAHKIK